MKNFEKYLLFIIKYCGAKLNLNNYKNVIYIKKN